MNLTPHAYQQLLERLGIPKTYVDRLLLNANQDEGKWAHDLLLENLLELSNKLIGNDRLLIRKVGNTVKAVLSSSYRRMDAAPIFQSFIQEGLAQGLVPIDGVNSDTRYHIKMLSQDLYQPSEDEVMAFGMSLSTSDYGAGALQVQFFAMRLLCTNFMIGEDCLRKVHIGRRFGEGDQFSQKTYDLDTKAVSSAVRDIISEGIEPRANALCARIEQADVKAIDVTSTIANMRRTGVLTKDMADTAKALYENVDNIEMLPQQEGAWRFANVLSLMAQKDNLTGDKKLELESKAMSLVA